MILKVDPETGSLITQDHTHYEIHEGDHFFYTEYHDNHDIIDGPIDILIVTPDSPKIGHWIFVIDNQLKALVELWEGADRDLGVEKVTYNSDRNSSNIALTKLYANGGGGSTDGVKILGDMAGIDTGAGSNNISGGGQNRNDDEIKLKRNTQYILRVTTQVDSNVVSFKLSFYEHTDPKQA